MGGSMAVGQAKGITVRVGARTVRREELAELLEQRKQRALTFGSQLIFSGVMPEAHFHPPAGSAPFGSWR